MSVSSALKSKLWKIPIWLLIILLGIGAISGAIVYTLLVPSTITILEPPAAHYEIRLYWDNNCISEVASLEFGELEIGQTASVTFFVKNLSNVTVDVHAGCAPIGGEFQFSGWQRNIAPNEVREWTLDKTIPPMAQPGTFAFDMILNVYPSS